MKNLKKVLAMVLAFACTFTMFASAKVYEDVPAGSDFSEAITMLSDLGIIQGKTDNKYHPDDTITRAEACALIARLMTGDPNAAGFGGAHHFKDVPAGFWASSAIGYCVVNGITVGVDQAGTRFEPQRPIKDKEFVTMIVRALGYETPDMKKDFPFGYMSAAHAIGLLNGVNMVPDTDALRGEDAQIIYNAMFTDYARGDKMINTTHGTVVERYASLAETIWHMDRAAVGTWSGKDNEEAKLSNCKAHTWVVVGADKDAEGRILAYPIKDDEVELYESDKESKNGTKYVPYSFKYDGDVESIKGYQVELWGSGKHGEPVWEKGDGKFVYSDSWDIKAIKTVKGQTKFDYNASQADSKSDNGTIDLGEDKKVELDSVADNASKVTAKNTTETPLTTYLSKVKYNQNNTEKDKDVERALNVRDGAQYKLMDWDSDGDIDWIVVDEANYFKVESASSKRLTVSSMKTGNEEKQTTSETETWKLDDLNDEKDYKIKYEVPEGLKEGDIIELTYKTAYDKSEKCEIVTATATVVEAQNHELDKVSTKDHLVLTFDGETKQLAEANDKGDTIVPANPSAYEKFDEEELGTQFALRTNRNGFIIYSDYVNETANYMMVLDTADGNDGPRQELGALNILTSDNKVEKGVKVASDLRIDGSSSGNGYSKGKRQFDESMVVGNVYKYWKDADGVITKMESAIKFGAKENGTTDDTYDYVAKNDRLTLSGTSYALNDAKVIFAVKPHNGTDDYIQYERPGINALKVDEDDVLAVKAADIPDIGEKEDTRNHTLDKNSQTTSRKSWINNTKATVAIDADNNKDVKAAVLGVENFNKFNAGSTKVGLVTNVSYDKSDVVSVDVATNGKVETISSAEKSNFEDIVSVLDYTNKDNAKSYSIGSRTEKIKNGLMTDYTLKDYLNKNGAYAEITTNADGKLTGILFMDEKTDDDGASGQNNEDNVVVGNYYQVSRKVVADVKEGKWMSVMQGSATYANKDAFTTMDSKNKQQAADFAGDVSYYVIDGKPTKNIMAGAYEGSKASVLDGFDGNPDVKVGEASDVRKSDIRDDANAANDIYYTADVASKIDAKGEGDIVAVYMYDDDMSEKIGIKGLELAVPEIVEGQEHVEVAVTLPTDDKELDKFDKNSLYVELVENKDGKDKVLQKVDVKDNKATLSTKDLKTKGNYTVKLYGYNKTDKQTDVLKTAPLTVEAKQMYTVSAINWAADSTGAASDKPVILAGTKNTFYVKLTANDEVATLTDKDMTVTIGNVPTTFAAHKMGATGNVFEVIVNTTIEPNALIKVELKTGGVLTGTMPAPITGNAIQGTNPIPPSADVAKVGSVEVKVDAVNKDKLLVQVLEGAPKARAARAAGDRVTTLRDTDFVVTVNGAPVRDLKTNYDMSKGCYVLTASNVSDWTADTINNVKVTVGEVSDTVAKMSTTAKIEDANNQVDFVKGTKDNVVFTPTLTNLFNTDVQLKTGADSFVSYDAKTGEITVEAAELNKKNNNDTVQFTLESKTETSVNVEYTITVKVTPATTAPTVNPNSFTLTKGTAVPSNTTSAVTYTGQGTLKLWKDGQQFTDAAESITDIVKGVNVTLSGKTITLTGTPSVATGTPVKFYVGTSADNKADLTVTVQDSATQGELANAGRVTTEGVSPKPGQKATSTYTVSNPTMTKNANITVKVTNGTTAEDVSVTNIALNKDQDNTAGKVAKKIRDALKDNEAFKKLYAVKNANEGDDQATVVVETVSNVAKTITLTIEGVESGETIAFATNPTQTPGEAVVNAVQGKAELKINRAATADEAGTYTVTVKDIKKDVTVTANNTAEQIADSIVKVFTDVDVTAAKKSGTNDTVEFTEKSGKEGTKLTNATTISFAKKQ